MDQLEEILVSLQNQLSLTKKDNLYYLTTINEQTQEINNLKDKIVFLEKEIEKNKLNESINKPINNNISIFERIKNYYYNI
jgi:hypothetical protein